MKAAPTQEASGRFHESAMLSYDGQADIRTSKKATNGSENSMSFYLSGACFMAGTT